MMRCSLLVISVVTFSIAPVNGQDEVTLFLDHLAPENYPWKMADHDSLVVTHYLVPTNATDHDLKDRRPNSKYVLRYCPELCSGRGYTWKNSSWQLGEHMYPDTSYHSLIHERQWFMKLLQEQGFTPRVDTSRSVGFNGTRVIQLYYRIDALHGDAAARIEQFTLPTDGSDFEYEVIGGFSSGMKLTIMSDSASYMRSVIHEKFNLHGDRTFKDDARWSEMAQRNGAPASPPLRSTFVYKYGNEGFWVEREDRDEGRATELTVREFH